MEYEKEQWSPLQFKSIPCFFCVIFFLSSFPTIIRNGFLKFRQTTNNHFAPNSKLTPTTSRKSYIISIVSCCIDLINAHMEPYLLNFIEVKSVMSGAIWFVVLFIVFLLLFMHSKYISWHLLPLAILYIVCICDAIPQKYDCCTLVYHHCHCHPNKIQY